MSTATYRPNGAGTNTNIEIQYPASTAHYDKVDEASKDDDTTYVYTGSATYRLDTYAFANPTETGIINSITVYAACARSSSCTGKAKVAIYTSGQAAQYGSEETLGTSYVTYEKAWTTNPWTSAAWSWSDLNALEIGVSLKGDDSTYVVKCTQVYIVIDYSAGGGSYAVALGL